MTTRKPRGGIQQLGAWLFTFSFIIRGMYRPAARRCLFFFGGDGEQAKASADSSASGISQDQGRGKNAHEHGPPASRRATPRRERSRRSLSHLSLPHL